MIVWAVVLLVVVILFMAISRNEIERRRARSATASMQVDDYGIRRLLADGREEVLAWGELVFVDVVRAKWGPHAPSGGVVMLGGPDAATGALVPIDQLGDSGLVEHLAALEGFDMEAFTAALEASAPANITIWRRGGA